MDSNPPLAQTDSAHTDRTESTSVALVTGAARRVGAQIARTLHQRGLNIIIHCNNSVAEANQLKTELELSRPDSVRILQANLNNENEVISLAADTLKQWQRLDVLVNNASTFYPKPLLDSAEEDWLELIGSNLHGPLLLTQQLADALAKQQGAIVNIIDIYAEKPLSGYALYSIAKAGLAQLTRASAKELGPDIRVNGVAPGPILWPENAAEVSSEQEQRIVNSTALKRAGSPDDIAGAVAFMALDAAFITGQILAVDGGRSLSYEAG